MEPVSVGQTAWTIFSTCYAVYDVVSQAIEINTESQLWHVQMRVERVRFQVWGRTLGFLDEKTGACQDPSTASLINTGGLSEILESETVNKLICDLLRSISSALSEFSETVGKYSLGTKEENEGITSRLNKAWSTTKVFSKRVVYVLTEKGLVEQLIQRLSGLNDSLEKLLTLSQKVQYTKAVSSGVLVKYQRPGELDGVLEAVQSVRSVNIEAGILVVSARVKRLCMQMDDPESSTGTHSDTDGENLPTAPHAQSFRLSRESITSRMVPTRTRDGADWPLLITTFIGQGDEGPRWAIVDWRHAKPSNPRFGIEESQLVRRWAAIVQLLHETSNMAGAGDYRLLDCVGYIEDSGSEDGQNTPVVGFISLFPPWADEESVPVTLFSLLQQAFDSDSPGSIPSLGTRFTLARSLANALYQLQCSNWLHRNLSSSQVLFFTDPATHALRLDRPYLIGFQYSRPDDNNDPNHRRDGRREDAIVSEGMRRNRWASAVPELYLPPRFADPTRHRRYRRSDDVYSLGVMLFEIAFWEPVYVFHEAGNTADDTARRVLETVEAELAAEVGEIYADAVRRCLVGLRPLRKGEEKDGGGFVYDGMYDGTYGGEDPEFGLEVDFLWKVLRELEKCRV